MTVSWYLAAAVGLAVLAAQIAGVPPLHAVGLALAAAFAVVGFRIAMEVRRQLRRQEAAVRGAVRDAGDALARTSQEARTRRERVEWLISEGRLTDAVAHAEPLIAGARDLSPGWGVAEAACDSTASLTDAFIDVGDEQGTSDRLEVLAELIGRADLGVTARITTMAAMRRTLDGLLQRCWWRHAIRALDVVVAAHRGSPGLEGVRDGAITRVLLALLDAGEHALARDVHRQHVADAVPPVQIEASLAARLVGESPPP